MTVGVVRTEWSGTSGGPGLTQLAINYQGGSAWTSGFAQSAVDAVRAFWNSMAGYLPNEVSLKVLATVDQYDQATGLLSGTTTAATSPLAVAGTSASNYPAGCGMRMNWNTGVIRNGHRVKGRTYIVPAASTIYAADGTIQAAAQTAINGYATTLLSALSGAGGSLMVWSRPQVQGVATGVLSGVVSGVLSSKTAIMRSRRD